MATKEQIKEYCTQQKLVFADRPQLDETFGDEEWEGMQCAGFDGPLGLGVPVICLKDDGTVEVMVAFADGEKWMEDKFAVVLPSELDSALRRGRSLHIKV